MPKFYIGVWQREQQQEREREQSLAYISCHHISCVCVCVWRFAKVQAAVITYKAARQVAGSKSTEKERETGERAREREGRGLLYSKTTHLHMYMQGWERERKGKRSMSWQQEIPFICSTLLHSYRILCAPTDMPCPLPTSPVPSPHHPLLVLYTYTHTLRHIWRCTCDVVLQHFLPFLQFFMFMCMCRIWKFSTAHVSLFLSSFCFFVATVVYIHAHMSVCVLVCCAFKLGNCALTLS